MTATIYSVDWWDLAICNTTDPEAFYPELGESCRSAKRVCAGCDVAEQCLEYALTHDERFGVWGGTSPRERKRLKHEGEWTR